jgi:hypothetical protein
MNGSLNEELRALALALDAIEPPPSLRRRVIEGDTAKARSRMRAPWLPLVAFAAGVALTLWLGRGESSSATSAAVATTPSAVAPAPCHDGMGPTPVAVVAPCRVELAEIGVVVDVWSTARLSVRGRSIAMPEGAASFEVEPVGDAPPVEIDVGAGRVRVLGTRFEIQNTGALGHLDLIRGRVEFHGVDGRVRPVTPGERLSWDRHHDAPAAEGPAAIPPDLHGGPATEAPPNDRPRPAVAESQPMPTDAGPDVDAVLEEVARLRHAGEHGEAESRLRELSARVDDRRTKEVLSFEIGTLIELAGADERACEHWRAHLEGFPGGRSSVRVADHRERLGCETE